jgi:hypothetical protein
MKNILAITVICFLALVATASTNDHVLLITIDGGAAYYLSDPGGAIADVAQACSPRSDGALLHAGDLDYRGHRLKFTEWAARDAKAFRSETERAHRTFAWAIMEQLFALDTRK